MIRLWRDSTAPRRLGRNRGEQRRIDESLIEAEENRVRLAWKSANRISPF